VRLRLWGAHALTDTGGNTSLSAVPGAVLGLRGGELHVTCGVGTLAITQLQPPGKRAMAAADFMHGHGPAPLRFT